MPFEQLLPWVFLLLLTVAIPLLFRKKYMILLFCVFSIFSCFRYGVGWDYFNYIRTIVEGGWMIERTEFVMRQFEYFVQSTGYPQLFFITTGLVTISCYFLTINKFSKDKAMSLILFLCLPVFFLSSISVIRFSVAVAVIFYAYRFVNKNIYIYLSLFVLAFFIHKASFIAVLSIPFVYGKVKLNLMTNIVVFAVCFVIGLMYNVSSQIYNILVYFMGSSDFLSETYENSLSYFDGDASGFSRSPFLYAAINICNFVWYNKLTDYHSDKDAAKYVTLFNLGCSLMFLFSFDATMASRLSQVFMIYILLLCPSYNRIKKQKSIILVIVVIAFIFQLGVPGKHPDFIGRWNCYLPYRFVF